MGIENPTPTYIDDLVATDPTATDPLSQADDHIRNIKRVLKQTFPNITGPVTKTQAQLDSTHAATATSATTAGTCTGNAATATSAGTCTGNAATATSAGTCTGNAATATTAAACTGNAATATTAATATNANAVDGKSISVVASMPGSPDANTIYFVTG